jgi:signal recognition particle receptor subunit beta
VNGARELVGRFHCKSFTWTKKNVPRVVRSLADGALSDALRRAMSNNKIKLLFVGPEKVGKTTVANFLSDFKDTMGSANDEYMPTVGCRILEFEREVRGGRKKQRSDSKWSDGQNKLAIELWDCSGHQRYEPCWPALMQDANAVVVMYNPENRGHEREVELWYEWFVQKAGIDDDRCLVLAHHVSSQNVQRKRPPKALSQCTVVQSSFDDLESLRNNFDRFLGTLA